MGFFDRLRGKKKDDLNLDNMSGMGGNFGGPQNFNEPLGSPDQGFDQGFGMAPPIDQSGAAPGMQPMTPMSPEAMGFERVPSGVSNPAQHYPQQNLAEINMGKDLEIISAKLDAIKAELDSMGQRMKRLERLAEGGEGSSFKDKWNY